MKIVGNSPEDAIKTRTLNVTRGSSAAAALTAAAVVFNDIFKQVFGDGLEGFELAKIKATILVAVIAAIALIVVADVFARAIAERTTAVNERDLIAAAPSGLRATKTAGPDAPGFLVAAVRYKPATPDEVDYLLAKADTAPEWVAGKDIELSSAR
jgi:short subunit fatty acids transporter